MKTTITEKDGRLVVSFEGGFDTVASNQAECDLAPVFGRNDCDVVIDCSELKFISSSGLRLLLNIYKHVRNHGNQAFLRGVEPVGELYEALDVAGFFLLFKQE